MSAGQRIKIGDRVRAAELGCAHGRAPVQGEVPIWILVSDPLWNAYESAFNEARRQEVPTDGPAR